MCVGPRNTLGIVLYDQTIASEIFFSGSRQSLILSKKTFFKENKFF